MEVLKAYIYLTSLLIQESVTAVVTAVWDCHQLPDDITMTSDLYCNVDTKSYDATISSSHGHLWK